MVMKIVEKELLTTRNNGIPAKDAMAQASKRPRESGLFNAIVHSFHGEPVQNAILLALPSNERAVVFSKMEFVQLPTRFVLNDTGQLIKYGYFVNSGVASVLNVMSDGKSVETGLIGKEGFIGLPLVVGLETSPTRAVMQIAGTGFSVSARNMRDVLRECPELEKHLHSYSHVRLLHATQLAAAIDFMESKSDSRVGY
jgi:CRP-like cAMP-binding protein